MRRRTRLFQATKSQTLSNGIWVDDPSDGASSLEEQINAWLDLTGAELESISLSSTRYTAGAKAYWTLFGAVVYSDEAAGIVEAARPEESAVPLMWARVQTPEGVRKVKVSTGYFGTIPGTKLHPDDAEPPPLPLLAPNCEWRQHGELFA